MSGFGRSGRWILLVALPAAVLAVGMAGQAAATSAVITVCPSGCQYSSIQDAINAASSGATLTIAPGTYTGRLHTEGKNLALVGAGAGQTTISGGGHGGVIRIASGTVAISGVTITGGSAESGAGIVNHAHANLTLIDSTVSGNTARSEGGGIDNYADAELTLSGSTVTNNTAFAGAGISNGGTVTLSRSTVSVNTAELGGGILNTGTATLYRSLVTNNTARANGGGIYNAGTATLNESRVTNNTASDNTVTAGGKGGGIYNNRGTATLNESTISNNTASGEGGGIYNNGGTVTLNNSTVSCNSPNQIVGSYTQKDSTIGGSCT